MYSTLFALFAFVVAVFAADLSVNTPQNVQECKRMTLTWQGGKAPYAISVLNATDPCGESLAELPDTNDTWYHWASPNVTGPVIFAVVDGNGDEEWTNALTIANSTTGSCTATGSGSGTTMVVTNTAPPAVPSAASSDAPPIANAGNGGLGEGGALSMASVQLPLVGSFVVGVVSLVLF